MTPPKYGWAGSILRINLTERTCTATSTGDYASKFIGGRGLASRLYWDEMSEPCGAFDPDNCLYFMNGPLGGTRAPGSSRWIVVGKSPMALPEQYANGNMGGTFGAALKWAGLDGLAVTGRSTEPVILLIEPEGRCSFEPAGELWGRDTAKTIAALENRYGPDAHVATIGRGGEMGVRFATIIASGGAVATKGFGAVMGSKNLKAIVVRAPQRAMPEARSEDVTGIRREITRLWKGKDSGRFWSELMLEETEKVKNQPCFGCPGLCRRGVYRIGDGMQGHRKGCMASVFYYAHEMEKRGKMGEVTFYATELANRHGLCALEMRFLLLWLPGAIERGVIDPSATGLHPQNMGTREWIENLVNLIISRNGVGDLLAEGSRRSANRLGVADLLVGLVRQTGFDSDFYSPRLFLAHAPIYATEPLYPITQLHRTSAPMFKWIMWMATEGAMGFLTTEKLQHLAQTFWGDKLAADMDSIDTKGAAAVINQNRCYAMENMVYCDWFWPIDYTANTETGVGDPTLESRLFSAVTGVDMSPEDYLRSGERCVNLCRAIYLREGRRGRIDDTLEEFNFTAPLQKQDPPIGLFNPEFFMPDRNGELVSRMGAVVDRADFKKVMDEYYAVRGWDAASGLQKRETLERLDLSDLVPYLRGRGLMVE
jgi:aldehyde:ferredoxin oxidoreductase